MNDVSRLGQFSIWVVYCALGLISTIISKCNGYFDNKWNWVLFFLWIMGFVGNIYADRSKYIKKRSFHYNEFTWLTLLSVGWSFIFKNSNFIMLTTFIQWVVIVLFLDKKLCKNLMVFHIVILSLITFLPGKAGSFRLTYIEYASSIIIILIVVWIGVSLINLLLDNERRNENQEKSMDNLLKVLEIKCFEAREATKSKSDFLANMSHEIRTPINSVLGMNEMILRESKEEKIRDYATNVENSGKMLLSLINDILDFSKIESGKMDLVLCDYRLSSVINDVSNMIYTRVKEKNLNFVIDIDENTYEKWNGDEVRIKQVLTNLLTNAVKYTEKGEIKLVVKQVEIEKDNNLYGLNISVVDTGNGIKEEDMVKLFESFQRIDEKKNRNIEGTGLGLALTKRLINLMDGKLSVETEYGKGSTFKVFIPQTVVDYEEKVGDLKTRFKNTVDNKEKYVPSFIAPDVKILIVDDVRVNLLVAKALLKQTKVKTDTVLSGEQTIKKLQENSYDIVLLDHMMPQMDGIETLHKIREMKIAENTVFIVLTANAVSGAQQMYLDAGFDDYLSKPIEGKTMEKTILKWLPKEKIERC